jgi:hypothetical protein
MSATIELVSIKSNKNAINDEEISTTTVAASEEIGMMSLIQICISPLN